ncbi:hypothetical protein MEM_04980 [Candida albicans L26]|nr:conserved hypothetical protein [Candida albicans WO-1]KGQ83496.1 hypothetical protein MEO_04903 [Candida albicans P94015]KGQ85325.1 hypothetical protein MEU_04974 [Candida albicans P37005]KGQ87391.1 hypothetical protein MG1_04990 [Candida albicans GC75]KGR09695.1 hypothetical protein MG9_04982 [Candida albicans P37037]KGU03975.1 hypothetical protein MEQ_04935 [Candida albicans P87]KGU04995.1 hypothetical protein MEM_04980 [Candida albicans L26]KGU21019.1 hypothetical protein MG7_04984 [Ca
MFKSSPFKTFVRTKVEYVKNTKFKPVKYSKFIPKTYTFHPYEPAKKVEITSSLQQLKNQVKSGDEITKEQYLNSPHFKFQEGKEGNSLAYLRQCISLINSGKPLIAMDCESYERNHSQVTEIGVAIMTYRKSTVPQIKTIHVVVKEHFKKRNTLYVPDKKDQFMGGSSFVMTENKTRIFLQKLLDKYVDEMDGVFVGHQVSSELKYFKSIGVNCKADVHTIDTMKLMQLSKSGGNSLWATLRELEIPYGHLHNAGNDAYFTLLAALSLCDPIVRIDKNLDIYMDSPYKGKKAAHDDSSTYFVVEDIEKVIESL